MRRDPDPSIATFWIVYCLLFLIAIYATYGFCKVARHKLERKAREGQFHLCTGTDSKPIRELLDEAMQQNP